MTLLADAARLLKSTYEWQCKSKAHVHKSLRGTGGTRSPKDGTAPIRGTKGLRPTA